MGVGFLFLGFVRKQEWLGGELGISRIPSPGLGDIGYMSLVLVLAALVIGFSLFVKRSWMGFAFDAVADDEDTARTVGVDVTRYKLTAFGLGTAIAGLAGGLYAHFTRFIIPDAFDFITSITVLAMVVVGGIGSTWGVLAAAVVLVLMPELFRFVNDYKLLIYGALILVVMRFSPGGLAGLVRQAAQSVRAR
jgi:branched-chain amino acid transport system permease protein